MKVEIRAQKGVPQYRTSDEDAMGTQYQVVLLNGREEVIAHSFSTPGTFLDGFLSDTQARNRAKDCAQRLKEFFGEVDVKPASKPMPNRSTYRDRASNFTESRSFAPTARRA